MMRVSFCAFLLSLIVKLSENKSLNEDLKIRMDKFTCKIKPMIETWLNDNGISNKGDISVLVKKCGEQQPGGTPTSIQQAQIHCQTLLNRLGRCKKASKGREITLFQCINEICQCLQNMFVWKTHGDTSGSRYNNDILFYFIFKLSVLRRFISYFRSQNFNGCDWREKGARLGSLKTERP